MHVTFPHQIMDQSARFYLVGQSQAVQQSINGATTVTASLAARWEASITFVIRDEAAHLAFRAFLAGLEGVLGTTNVPAGPRFRPLDRDGHGVTRHKIASLSDAQTMEHFGLENEPVIAATLAASAPLRAVDLQVTETDTTGIRPGHRFSIGDRLHEVQLAWTDGTRRLRIQPPLRAAVASSVPLQVHHPICRMRRADAGDVAYDERLTRMQSVTMTFVEDI